MPISNELLTQWTIRLAHDQAPEPQPTTLEETQVVAQLRRDIAAIKSSGGVVELPFELA